MYRRANWSLVLGAAMGLFIVMAAILVEVDAKSAGVFIHPVSLLIVFGGMTAAALVQLPPREIFRILRRTYHLIRAPRNNHVDTVGEIIAVSMKVSQSNTDVFAIETNEVRNSMLRDALQLILMGFKAEEIRKFLESRREQTETGYLQCSIFYASLSKLGPAAGLLGTLIGLIAVLYFNMSANDMSKVAGSMGIALTATLYGVGISNLILSPLAEYVAYCAEQNLCLDNIVIEGALLLKEGRHPFFVVQSLKSHIPRDDYAALEAQLQGMNQAQHMAETGAAA